MMREVEEDFTCSASTYKRTPQSTSLLGVLRSSCLFRSRQRNPSRWGQIRVAHQLALFCITWTLYVRHLTGGGGGMGR